MRRVTTPDGRVLAVEEWGEPDGTPVLYAHGTPMSRLARHPDGSLFTDLGVRLITYDRPGMGASTPNLGRAVVDAAADMLAIVDALHVDRLPVFGVSGGGPHALAFAATHPERVSRVATMVSTAPCDAVGLEWTEGMMSGNQASSRAALTGREDLAVHLAKAEAEVEPGGNLLPPAEQEVLARPEVQEMIAAAYAEALRPGIDGWVDDVLALYGLPWGFDPADITVPVMLWHGGTDTVVPAAHTAWLAERIPDAESHIDPAAGHGGHFDATPGVLRWLLA